MEEQTYTLTQVARLLHMDVVRVRQLVRHGIIEAEQVKVGRRYHYRIKQSALDRYLHIK